MASVYRRPRSPFWWIKYRDHDGNVVRKSSGTDDEAEALDFAKRVEDICKIAREHNGSIRNGALEELVRLGIIDANELLPKPTKPEADPLDLEALADSHPSVRSEREKRPHDYTAHKNRLREFIAASGVRTLRELTGSIVREYLARLARDGKTEDQIKHRMVFLRAAAAMAPELGHPNPIANVRMPLNVAQTPLPPMLTMEELAKVLGQPVSGKSGELTPRVRIAIGLMGLMGLGLSEACRLHWSDLREDILHVGVRKAKNRYRNRMLPMPPTLFRWLMELKETRDRDEEPWTTPIMLSHRRRTIGDELDHGNLGRDVETAIQRFTGNMSVTAKSLRKSFATIAVWEVSVPAEIVEAFMGRRVSGLGPMTSRHYLGKASAERLRPWAEAMDESLRAHIQGTQRSKHCK